jgi:hypothetical protein
MTTINVDLPEPDGNNIYGDPAWSTSFGEISTEEGVVCLNGLPVDKLEDDARRILAAFDRVRRGESHERRRSC